MKYKVVASAFWLDGVKYKRGDIVESDADLGTRVEAYTEPKADIKADPVKPKRKRRTKAEIEADLASTEIDVPKFGEDVA